MTVTLINAFEVPEERADEFLATWTSVAGVMTRQPGYVSTSLHRALAGAPRPAPFRFVNVALWESAADLVAATQVPEFREHSAALAPFTSHPGMYEEVWAHRAVPAAAPPVVTGDLYAEVQTFFARQMRLADGYDIKGFAATFTPDGVIEHASRGERLEGREALVANMEAALPRYEGLAVRHWFDKLLIEPLPDDPDEAVKVSYYTLVTRVDASGTVTFEPTFTVEDVLVRRDGELATRSRVIHKDTP